MGAPPGTDRDTTEGLGEILTWFGVGLVVILVGLPLLGAVLGLVALVGATVIATALWLAPILVGLAVLGVLVKLFLDA
jgi:hypothetical protein